MTVRLFVTSASLMIFCWLAATYLRAVPMESYPSRPAASVLPSDEVVPVTASTEDTSVRLISTAN